MRAVLVDRYGDPDVARVTEIDAPIPGPGQCAIDVHACSVTSGDARMRAARFPPGMSVPARLALGWSGPRRNVLGVECAGVIAEVGPGVDRWRVGDRVVAALGMLLGGHAERCLVRADGCMARLPASVDFVQAAALPFGGTTALSFLARRTTVRAGERVLIVGASGAVGTACIQIARRLGARVTALCSTANADLVRSLGAERVVDYTQETPRGQWEVVMDTVGAAPIGQLRGLLTPDGRLALIAAGIPQMLAGPWIALTSRQRLFTGIADEFATDLEDLVRWHAAGEYQAVVDEVLPLEAIAAAYARVDSGRKRGTLVLRVR